MKPTEKMPALFVSQGLPPLALFEDDYANALIQFGQSLPKDLQAIVCVSSHWISPGAIQITASLEPEIQHNFTGYQDALYELDYKIKGSLEIAEIVADHLEAENFEVNLNFDAPIDHGVWMPLRRIRPWADIPVIQISLPMFADPRLILKLGHSLAPLREKGVLLLGSGSAAMNPNKIIWHARNEDVHPKINEFSSWLKETFVEARIEDILDYKTAPQAEFSHPNSANLMPLFFIMGTSKPGDAPQIVYEGFKYGSASLLTLKLDNPGEPGLKLSLELQ